MELNQGFFRRVTQRRPWVRVKVAASLDGRAAMASGESQWITGAEARADGQYWRARSCAIVTGIGTVLADDPQLNVRDSAYAVDGVIRQPLRVVVDSALRTPPTAKLLQTRRAGFDRHARRCRSGAALVERQARRYSGRPDPRIDIGGAAARPRGARHQRSAGRSRSDG